MKQLLKMFTVSGVLRLIAAGILAQTLFFKFTASPESVYIFTTLGVEPWGRIAAGVMELIAVMLLLSSRAAGFGALLAAGMMIGAIGSHVTRLGIEVQGDGGLLFALACIVLAASAIIAARSQAVRNLAHRLTAGAAPAREARRA